MEELVPLKECEIEEIIKDVMSSKEQIELYFGKN